jgi:RNA polymerase sigma-70 factor (ECF subfamily)
VLGYSARETATLLETSAPAVNSALQRARAAMADHLPQRRLEWAPGTDPSGAERELLERLVAYSETPDVAGLAELMHEELRFSMPPQPGLWEGRDVVVGAWVEGGFGSEAFGSLRCLVTRANRQPAVANYVRKPDDDRYVPLALDVLTIADGAVIEIVTFDGSVFDKFGLPDMLAG